MAKTLATLTLAFFSSLALAQSPRAADLVHPQLLADTTAIQPGRLFHLAILLHISPHWHVYWKNPGDSGQAVSSTFSLPTGFTSSPLQFPVPTKFLQPGDLIAYGYENEVLLLTTITPPANLPATDPITLQANLKFLVCDQTCLPGHASLSLTLPISADSTPANPDLFKEWLPQFPTPPATIADIHTTSSPISIDITW
ncbi:MAG TPA: protein-disulfide reductase DsbD domain-containing protein, partial [Tepidisphaeraceae bacterium]|nr:protein-disulfide reductase DsbD domain-containing protein [Tepidisphaeraceae bacterium]